MLIHEEEKAIMINQIVRNSTNSTVPSDVSTCLNVSVLYLGYFLSTFIIIGHFSHFFAMYKTNLLRQPRGIIFLSLALSDLLLPLVIIIHTLGAFVFQMDTPECRVLLELNTFIIIVAVGGSSLSIIALAVERYIFCMYGPSLYTKLENNIKPILIMFWMLILLQGSLSFVGIKEKQQYGGYSFQMKPYSTFTLMIAFSTTSLVLIVAQVRLFCLGRSKIEADIKIAKDLHICDQRRLLYRRKRMKLAATASALAICYVACCIPGGCLMFACTIRGLGKCVTVLSFVGPLIMFNSLMNPVLYSLTITETKRYFKMKWRQFRGKVSDVPITVSTPVVFVQ